MKTRVIDNAFLHSVAPDGKVELAILLSNSNSRKTIDRTIRNINAHEVLKCEDARLESIPGYMKLTRDKRSTTNISEGTREFVAFRDRVYLVRLYKLVGTNYHKLEVTRRIEAWEREWEHLDDFVRLMGRLVHGTEKAILPPHFHGGTDWTPIKKYYGTL